MTQRREADAVSQPNLKVENMFERFSRAIRGIPTPAQAERHCREWFDNLRSNLAEKTANDDAVKALYQSKDFRDAFYRFLTPICAKCFGGSNKHQQLISLRRQIVECYERAYLANQ